MAPPPPLPLANNGTIKVRFGEGLTKELNYDLTSIHFSLNESTGVANVTLNEPERLNALTVNQQWEMMLILRHAANDDRVKCLVWTGHGRAFSSGADLSGRAPKPTLAPEAQAWFQNSQGFLHPKVFDGCLKCLTLEFWDFPKPSIVAVNGLTIGGAVNIALANFHDIVLASTDAYFRYPFSDIGITPELSSSFTIPSIAGMTRAKNILMLGEKFSAATAKDMGLVLEVTAPENLLARAGEYALKFASKNQYALRLSKQVINGHGRKHLVEIMDTENAVMEKAVQAMQKAAKAAKAAKPAAKL